MVIQADRGRMRRATLYREEEAIVVRAGHPLTQDKVTKQRNRRLGNSVPGGQSRNSYNLLEFSVLCRQFLQSRRA
jgi:hypothetical protein